MRLSFLLLAALVLAAPASAQRSEVPNGSFDVWGALDPPAWLVTNNEEGTFRTVDPVGDARTGPFAAKMTVGSVPGFPDIAIPAGMETCPPNTCRDDNGNTNEEATFPISGRHPAFCGYYKAAFVGGDRLLLVTSLFTGPAEEETIGTTGTPPGTPFITGDADEWTRFILPFGYLTDETPTHANIATTIVGAGGGPTPGSTASLDDLTFCELDGTPIGGGGGGTESGDALLILDDATAPSFADRNVEGLLTSLGFEVLVRSDEAATTGDAADKAVILISASVDPGVFAADYGATDVPLVVWEPALYGGLRMAGAQGLTAPTADLAIADATHPIADGFVVGDTTVTATALPMAFGAPGGDAVTVATAGGQATLFAYDDGAAMTTGTAPARRVAFFAADGATGDATPAGLDLLRNAIIWAADLDFTVAAEPIPGEVPDALTLGAPYPNPFAASTAFEYALPHTATVSLEVMDATGRRVAVLVEGEQPAGRYRVEWTPEGVAAGVYLGVLRTDAGVQTRRVVLTR